MGRPRNLVVAQSGGPSPVINNSLRAIVELARDLDAIGTVYGANHGIEGVLKEELIDLSAQPAEEIASPPRHARGRLDRHLPLQAQARPAGGFRAGDRRLQSPSRRLLPVHRRQRLDGYGPQGRGPGPGPAGWTWWRLAYRRRSITTWGIASSSLSITRQATARWPNTGCTACRTRTRRTPAVARPIRCS